jgi:hypothetical protein
MPGNLDRTTRLPARNSGNYRKGPGASKSPIKTGDPNSFADLPESPESLSGNPPLWTLLYGCSLPCWHAESPIAKADREGQRNKTAGNAQNGIALTAESALPPKKPPAPSVRHRLRRAMVQKLK